MARRPMSEEAKRRLSEYWKGKKKSPQHAENIRKSKLGSKNPMYGKRISPEGRKRQIEAMKKVTPWNKGKKCPQLATRWAGGKSTENELLRHSLEYRQWRAAIFERDDYTCQFCGERGGELNADHIKQFAYYPELRFDIDNGRTLCVPCHKTTPTYQFKRKEQDARV